MYCVCKQMNPQITTIIIFEQQTSPNSCNLLNGTSVTLFENHGSWSLRANGQNRMIEGGNINQDYIRNTIDDLLRDFKFQFNTYSFIAEFLFRVCETSSHGFIFVIDGVECIQPSTGKTKVSAIKLPAFGGGNMREFVLNLFIMLNATTKRTQAEQEFTTLEKQLAPLKERIEEADFEIIRIKMFLATYAPKARPLDSRLPGAPPVGDYGWGGGGGLGVATAIAREQASICPSCKLKFHQADDSAMSAGHAPDSHSPATCKTTTST